MSIYRKIPNLLTLLNLGFGCAALVYIFYDHISLEFAPNTSAVERAYFDGQVILESLHLGKMHIAALLVLAAALLDFFDGFVARLFNAVSDIGKQLDSLADLVTFGLVPGMMLYYLLGVSFFDSIFAFKLRIWAFLPGFLFTLTAAWRLAKFNVAAPAAHFRGLPVPAAAMFVIGLPLGLFFNEANSLTWLLNPWLLYGIIAVLSLFMISNAPMLSMKFEKGGMKGKNKQRIVFLAIALILFVAGYFLVGTIFLALPLIVIWYIIYSIIINITTHEVHS